MTGLCKLGLGRGEGKGGGVSGEGGAVQCERGKSGCDVPGVSSLAEVANPAEARGVSA